jgi:uncharacterized protein (UPF0332 family)
MNQVSALLDKSRNNLQAATLLRNEELYEIAASRAYYAMFYTAEALLLSQGLAFSSHSAVIAAYGKEFAKTGRIDPEHHRRLIDAFEARQISDYGIETGIFREQADKVINWAEDFIQAGELFLRKHKIV